MSKIYLPAGVAVDQRARRLGDGPHIDLGRYAGTYGGYTVATPTPTLRARLACWWFGCQPDYKAGMLEDFAVVPCERCGAPDTTYADHVGDTRHARMVDRLRRLRWRLLDSWRPKPCPACHGRKCKPDCDGIPF